MVEVHSVRAMVAIAGLAVTAMEVRAIDLRWNNPAGGSASTTSNWNPTQTPTSADALRFLLSDTYAVTYSDTVAAAASHSYEAGAVTATMAANYTIGGSLRVSGALSPAPSARLQGTGTTPLTTAIQGPVNIATALNTGGSLEFSGNGSSANTRTWNVGGGIFAGAAGTGSLSVTNAAILNAQGGATVGDLASSTGSLLLTGAAGTFQSARRSTMSVTGDLILAARGHASATLSQGALCTVSDDVIVSQFLNSACTLLVSGAAANGRPAELLINDQLLVGRNETSEFGGTATVRVGVGGHVAAAGIIALGDPNTFGTGTLRIEGGAVECAGVDAAEPRGILQLVNGTLTVRQGGVIGPGLGAYVLDGESAADNPVLIIDGASRFDTVTPTSIRVGNANAGTMRVINGSGINLHQGVLRLGTAAGGRGTLEISGPGSTGAVGSVYVGEISRGDFTLGPGAVILNSGLFIGMHPGATGSATIQGAGALFRAVGSPQIGGLQQTPGGTASLLIADAARLENLGASIDMHIWHLGSVVVQGEGVLTSAATIIVRGSLTVDSGTVQAPLVATQANGSVGGMGTVTARIASESTAAITARPTEHESTLTLGVAQPDGINLEGLLDAADATVVLIDSDGAQLANVQIAGGLLRCEQGIRTAPNSALSGFGTIDADFTPLGEVRTDERGLTFERRVNGFGQGFGGGTFRLGAASNVEGRGRVSGEWWNGGIFSPGPGATEVQVQGSFNNFLVEERITGTIVIDVSPSGNDLINISDRLTLGGTLEVRLEPGYQPAGNDRFVIVRAGAVEREFENLVLPPGFSVQYDTDAVILSYTAPCFADFNQDGGIDGADVDAFFAAWEGGDASADVNQDGGIDGADVDAFFAAWEAGAC
ncbi:MAG: hypothetical protein JSR77_13540 [Planctomycetes bacterium]|nr:hypothetical protein [Planctomycetota bacterium]